MILIALSGVVRMVRLAALGLALLLSWLLAAAPDPDEGEDEDEGEDAGDAGGDRDRDVDHFDRGWRGEAR